MGRKHLLTAVIALGTIGAFVSVALKTSGGAFEAATSPDWRFLGPALAVAVAVQPLRALAWRTTMREHRVEFRAIYAASAVGSFLDTVLPGRLGEASKVGVLRVAAVRWPGFSRTAGSLLCAHLLEAIAFALVGAASAFFLPFPDWARGALVGGLGAAAGGIALAAVLHAKVGRRLPRGLDRFFAGAAAPPRVLAKAASLLMTTWVARCVGIFCLLHAFGVEVGLGGALVYMIVTGLANTAPILPGNAGVYQGAAIGALALVGHGGANAVAISLAAPVVASIGTAAAAVVGVALYGRRFAEISRGALATAPAGA